MPAVTVENILVLPRLSRPGLDATDRAPRQVVTAHKQLEGAGFEVRRPFPSLDLRAADPFILLDHLGEVAYEPHEAKGAPWHPHRGFETVTYLLDGTFVHHDSHGGGGTINDGDTQWMTAGSGVLHDELPSEDLVRAGGWFHGVQLWVNLPRSLKWVDPRYQDLRGSELTLLASDDGGALVRLIAGELDGHSGPGSTYTPITYAHASINPGARLSLGWPTDHSALVYVLSGAGTVGAERRPLAEGQLAVLDSGGGPPANGGVAGGGGSITVIADDKQSNRTGALEVLLLGGRPIREPVVQYGPFVMNDDREILQAVYDYQEGRMGTIPAQHR